MLEVLGTLLLSFAGIFTASHNQAYAPEQIHAAWTEHTGEVSVMWSTQLPIHGSAAMFRAVTCSGHKVSEAWRTVEAEWTLFDQYSVLHWQSLQTAILKDLESRCFYEYKVGAGLYWSDTFQISGRTPDYSHTPPEISEKPATLVVLGDMGIGNWSDASRALLQDLSQTHQYDGLFHLGDIAYDLQDSKGKVGDRFLRDIQPIAGYSPYMVAPGNHEKKQNFTHYKTRFRMPRHSASQNSNFFYSLDLGRAHIVVISTELYSSGDNNQVLSQQNWLREDLKQANGRRIQVPWIVVMGHKPTYCQIDWTKGMESKKGFRSNNNCYKQSPEIRSFIEDILFENAVDLYIGAHVHKYERNDVIYRNQTYPSERKTRNSVYNPSAPVHILTGIAGNDHGPNPLSPTPQLWNIVQNNMYGFGILRIPNDTHLIWEHYTSHTKALNDYLTIEKSRPAYEPIKSLVAG